MIPASVSTDSATDELQYIRSQGPW